MIVLAILLVIGVAGVFIERDYKNVLGLSMAVVGFIFAFFVGLMLIIAPFEYREFEVEGKSFQQTLTMSREYNRKYESAAILKEIADWNKELAIRQYHNSIFIIGDWTDDRFDKLKPIQ